VRNGEGACPTSALNPTAGLPRRHQRAWRDTGVDRAIKEEKIKKSLPVPEKDIKQRPPIRSQR